MIRLFDEPWSSIELRHVEAFLADAGEEGVTWEAKADDDEERKPPVGQDPGRLRPATVRKAVSGLANQLGGYLIAGARWDKKAKEWTLPGIVVPDPEPELWLGKIISGLNPVPRFDPRAWTRPDGRVIAVVQVNPVDEPPCMTPQGHVYERVSGETIRVTDPTLLDTLIRRGRQARERSESFADRAALRALDAIGWKFERTVGLSIAVAPIGRTTDDIGSRLFTQEFTRALVKSLWAFFESGPYSQPDNMERRTQQDGFTALAHFDGRRVRHAHGRETTRARTTWIVQATWDGAVAASVNFSEQALIDGFSAPERMMLVAWHQLDALAQSLGGYGPAHLSVLVHAAQEKIAGTPILIDDAAGTAPPPPPDGTLYHGLPERTKLGRQVPIGAPDQDVVVSLHRELQRASGIESYEPESIEVEQDGS